MHAALLTSQLTCLPATFRTVHTLSSSMPLTQPRCPLSLACSGVPFKEDAAAAASPTPKQ